MADARTRLMLLRAYLLDQTDERHAVTLRELTAYLERRGVSADPRALQTDLSVLRESGLDVCTRKKRATEYYVGRRTFERAELRLLMDMVRASRFVSAARTDALLKKLSSLASSGEATLLLSHGGGANPLKTDNEEALGNIERILLAIEGGKKLSFTYCQYTMKKSLRPRRGGQAYVVSPCLLTYAEEYCYLIADHPTYDGLAHYRLDKMANLRVLEERAATLDASFDAAAYVGSVFSMYPAEQRWVRLAFDRSLVGAMIDRFGRDVPMEQLDEKTCALYAPVCVGRPFFGWVFQFCGGVRILAPDDVRERMLLMIEAARA